jgi:ubiquinone/menaquinone biosynthesis C-methylase UbiE
MAWDRRWTFVLSFVTAVTLLANAEPLAQRSAALNEANLQDGNEAAWLFRELEVKEGSTVGEIGAGNGALTLLVAKQVGPSGRVLSNELNPDRVKTIGAAAAATGLTNVTAVQGAEAETNFPERCCDAIFMRDVYHHFNDPPAMNASIFKSLKPGGYLGILDFTPPPVPGSENPPGHRGEDNHHGITAETLAGELKAAGFEIIQASTADRAVKVVARRPR